MSRNDDELIQLAKDASRSSYAPYSNFHVGAALRCDDGTVFAGANVENRSYGLGICAERSAIVAAVTAGHRRISEIVIYSPDAEYPLSPCGACRQVLSEFMPPEGRLVFLDRNGNAEEHSMAEVLPYDALHELRDR
jgi:cytidine deaminase